MTFGSRNWTESDGHIKNQAAIIPLLCIFGVHGSRLWWLPFLRCDTRAADRQSAVNLASITDRSG